MNENWDYWKNKLTPFDIEVCRMVADLTGRVCEPKNGDDHYFFEADYRDHNDPQYILAIWDAIVGRLGDRIKEISDDADRGRLFVRVSFVSGDCPDAEFVPRYEPEQK